MRKIGLALTAAVVLAAAGPSTASAAEPVTITGPCAVQQALFGKYGIQIDMYAPAVSYAYGTVCGVTG
jgi:hypothetical protein